MSAATDRPGGDDGRPGESQPGRTRLSWRRTTLAAVAVGLLAARYAVIDVSGPARTALLAAIVATAIGLLLVAQRRIAAIRHVPPPRAYWAPAGLAALVVAFAALGLAITLSR